MWLDPVVVENVSTNVIGGVTGGTEANRVEGYIKYFYYDNERDEITEW